MRLSILRAGFTALLCASAWATTAGAVGSPAAKPGAVRVATGLPASGPNAVQVGNALYDNTGNPLNTYYAGQNGAEAIDDLHLDAGGTLGRIEFEYIDESVVGTFSATVRIYDNPGGTDEYVEPLAGPYVISGLGSGRHLVTVRLPDRPTVGADLWVGVQFSSLTAGLVINDVPSVGRSDDLYWEDGGPNWFFGNPKANFALRLLDVPNFQLNVAQVGLGTVTKNPDQPLYVEDESVRLTATPEVGWSFTGWSGSVTSLTNPLDVVMDGDKAITATFEINTYPLDVTKLGQGVVSRSPDLPEYDHGTTVRLTATAAVGFSFTGWSGDASGSVSEVDVLMDGPKSVTATFTINTYALGVVVSGQGSVARSLDQTAYDHGTVVRLTATPQVGWSFVEWGGDASGTTSLVDVLMDGPKSVTATFVINTYGLDVPISGQGSVMRSPDQALYDHGTVVRLTATPQTGWSFTGWSGDVSGPTSPVDVTMDGPKSVTATFTINTYPLDVMKVGQGVVARSPDLPEYDHGTTVRVTAAAAVGWSFTGWSGDASGNVGEVDVVMDEPRSVTATFTILTFPLEVTPVTGLGTVTRAPDQAEYDYGTVVQLTATPQLGWSLVHWSGDASGTTTPVDVTMDGPKSVTATFVINTYVMTVTKTGMGLLVRRPDQALYEHGTSVELEATPAPGWRFVGWSGAVVDTAARVTLVMDAAKSIHGSFRLNLLPVADAVALPSAGPAPLFVELSGATTTDADNDSLTFRWTFGDGAEATGRRVSHTYTLVGNFTALLTVDDGFGGTDTANVAISVALAFPQTPVLDNFNRANGTVGTSWIDETSLFSIASQRLAPAGVVGFMEWAPTVFGSNQEAFVTLSTVTPMAKELNVMLKTQGTTWTSGHIEVSYRPALSRVDVRTYTDPDWTLWGTLPGVSFAGGDRLGARALDDGTVQVFKNQTWVGSLSVAGWQHASAGGRIGVSFDIAGASQFDDFGGGNFGEPLPSEVAISQIYGGGGTAGATLTNDFVELFNRGNSPVDLTGWSVQHASATGSTWSVTPLVGIIAPGGYYLIRQAGGVNGSVPLPAPDAVGVVNMNTSSGKVALVNRLDPLIGSCPEDAWVVDFVGFGTANCSEGSVAAAAGTAIALLRDEGGCEDTGNNAANLTPGTPAPRNSAAPPQMCNTFLAVGNTPATVLELSAPRPNPFRGSLRFDFGLARPTRVQLRVLDLQGRLVTVLADGDFAAGRHDVTWNGMTPRGSAGAGVYFLRMDALGESRVRKIVVSR